MSELELKLMGALRWLLDDMTDAGENQAKGADCEYDSVANAREILEQAEKEKRNEQTTTKTPNSTAPTIS